MTKPAAMIAGLFLLVYIAPLGLRPLMIPDETRYAEIPREMIATHDWVVPHLDGLRYFEKPVLGYWVTAASITAFGENAFAVRLPFALAVGLSALLLFLLVRRFSDDNSGSTLAPLVFLTCLEVFVIGTSCVLDTLFAFFITALMVVFFWAYKEQSPRRTRWGYVVCGVLCGLAFLTKGFIAAAVPLVAVIPFLLWECRLRGFLRICWLPLLAAVVIVLPWGMMIHQREADFWNFFFWNEHIRRFMGNSPQHGEPPWYFLVSLPGAAMPWTFLVPAALGGLKRSDFKNPLMRFAVCWFLFPLLFFSASRGKLLTYILPCFPPMAILLAVGLHHYSEGEGRKALARGAVSLAVLLAAGVSALVVGRVVGGDEPGPYAETWRWGLAVGVLGLGVCLLLLSWRVAGWGRKIGLFAVTFVPLMVAAPLLLPDQTVAHKAPGAFLLGHADRVRPDTILVTDRRVVRAACWFYKRDDIYLVGSTGELDYGVGYDDASDRALTRAQLRDMILDHQGAIRVTLIVRTKSYRKWRAELPHPVFEDSRGNGGFTFAQY